MLQSFIVCFGKLIAPFPIVDILPCKWFHTTQERWSKDLFWDSKDWQLFSSLTFLSLDAVFEMPLHIVEWNEIFGASWLNNAPKTFHSVLGIEFSHNWADNGYPLGDPVYLKDVQCLTCHNYHNDWAWGDMKTLRQATRSSAMGDIYSIGDLPERASPDEGVRLCKTKVAQPVKEKNLRDQWWEICSVIPNQTKCDISTHSFSKCVALLYIPGNPQSSAMCFPICCNFKSLFFALTCLLLMLKLGAADNGFPIFSASLFCKGFIFLLFFVCF